MVNIASLLHVLGLVYASTHVLSVSALTTPELRSRSIYQIFTDRFARHDGLAPYCDTSQRSYCGGTWKGIEGRLDYIQGMGFDTVWISPVVANYEAENGLNTGYHGYWTSDIRRTNDHFGTVQDLKDLSAALHARGMYLMVDVVANHLGAGPGWTPSAANGPFDTESHFHPFCTPEDWENQHEVEQCWLSEMMPDLNTENPQVIQTLHQWIRSLVQAFQIDALRVDTVKHVRKSFWPDFVRAAGVASMGEILHGNPAYLAPYQKAAMDSILDFANFYHVRRAFSGFLGNIGEFADMIVKVQKMFPDATLLGSFLDNHDFPRFAGTHTDSVLTRNAAVFPFVNDGFPIVYQGQEHDLQGGDDPSNREAIWLYGYETETQLYTFFRNLNAARKTAINHYPPYLRTFVIPHQINNHSVALRKGPLLAVLSNYGSGQPAIAIYLAPSQTGYKALLPLVDVLSGQILATDPRGGLTVPIIRGEPRVFLPLGLYRGGQSAATTEWEATSMRIEPGVRTPGTGTAPPSPSSPTTPRRNRRNIQAVMQGWLGRKNSDL